MQDNIIVEMAVFHSTSLTLMHLCEALHQSRIQQTGITGSIVKQTVLTHYHTMPQFDALKIYSCGKYCEKRRNCL